MHPNLTVLALTDITRADFARPIPLEMVSSHTGFNRNRISPSAVYSVPTKPQLHLASSPTAFGTHTLVAVHRRSSAGRIEVHSWTAVRHASKRRKNSLALPKKTLKTIVALGVDSARTRTNLPLRGFSVVQCVHDFRGLVRRSTLGRDRSWPTRSLTLVASYCRYDSISFNLFSSSS